MNRKLEIQIHNHKHKKNENYEKSVIYCSNNNFKYC